MKDFLEFVLIAVVSAVVVVGLLFGVGALLNLPEKGLCETIEAPHIWSPWHGCKVQTEGGNWIDFNDAWMLEVDPELIKDIEQ